MFLTISTTRTAAGPATDLGFLLHKHPDKAQVFSTSYGDAHVFYPEAGAERCTAALLLEVDPPALARRGRGKGRSGAAADAALAQYVNDRPYAASSLMAVALRTVFASALRGECRALPERAAGPLPLRIEVPALPARGGAALVARLFEPLGWRVTAEPVPLDAGFPEWGDSRYVRLELEGELRLSDALRHLYVLLPVLDDAKHYWVSADEVDKLLRFGEGWLAGHPEQQLITRRYLARRWALTREANERLELVRLADADDSQVEDLDNAVEPDGPDALEEQSPTAGQALRAGAAPGTEPTLPAGAAPGTGQALRAGGAPGTEPAFPAGGTPAAGPAAEAEAGRTQEPGGAEDGAEGAPERPVPLAVRRREAILAALRDAGAARVLDLGCGQGQLVAALLKEPRFTEVVGLDVSVRALEMAARRLRLDRMGERQSSRLTLLQGSLAYTDKRLKGYDAAVLSEVVEHLDPPRLPALEYAVFGAARPRTVIVTTPNVEYNVRWETLPAGHRRHADHRFEWTRAEFREWAHAVADRYGYAVEFAPVGPDDPQVGPPTQLARFTATDPHQEKKKKKEEAA